MTIFARNEAPEQHQEAAETQPPAPDSGRRSRPRDRMATLPADEDFERHDTIPAPPWFESPK